MILKRSFGIFGIALLLSMVWPGVTPVGAGQVAEALVQAFRHGNAAALQPLFPAEGRVQMSLAAAGIASGNYSPKQAVALLEQAFKNFETISFSVDERSGAVRGEWVIRAKGGGARQTVVLYVSVQTRKNTSVITSLQGN